MGHDADQLVEPSESGRHRRARRDRCVLQQRLQNAVLRPPRPHIDRLLHLRRAELADVEAEGELHRTHDLAGDAALATLGQLLPVEPHELPSHAIHTPTCTQRYLGKLLICIVFFHVAVRPSTSECFSTSLSRPSFSPYIALPALPYLRHEIDLHLLVRASSDAAVQLDRLLLRAQRLARLGTGVPSVQPAERRYVQRKRSWNRSSTRLEAWSKVCVGSVAAIALSR